MVNSVRRGEANRQWVVAEHAVTTLAERHFGYRETPVAEPGPGEVLLNTHLLNIAPVMRMYRMAGGAAGEAPLGVGDVIHGLPVHHALMHRRTMYPGLGTASHDTHRLGTPVPPYRWGVEFETAPPS